MPVEFNMKVNTRRLRRMMDEIPEELAPELARALDQHGFTFTAHLRRTRFGGGPNALQSRTGRLARSAGHRVLARNSIKRMRMVVFIGGGRAKWASIHETGGTIKGKPWLTVPLPDNLTGNGVPRFKSARRLKETKPGKTFITRTKKGNLLIGYKPYKKRKTIQWLWVLRRSVRLKPRLRFVRTWKSAPMRADRQERLRTAMRNAIRTARLKNKGGS